MTQAGRGGIISLPLREQTNHGPKELCIACSEGSLERASSLLESGVSANSKDKAGWPALLRAVQEGHPRIVRLLLDHGADVLVRGPNNLQALHLAVVCIDAAITRILLDHDASNIEVAPTGGTPIHLAVSKGSEEVVRVLIGKGANVLATVQPIPGFGSPGLGETALHMAVASWHAEMIPFLLSQGLDVNAQGQNPPGQTPLHIAAWYGYEDAAKMLLDNGADIHLPYANGHTALHQAAEHGRFEMVTLLLDRGANIHASTGQGFTALCAAAASSAPIAASTKRITVETLLKRLGDMSDSDKARVLWSTGIKGDIEGTAMLIENGFPVDGVHQGFTGLDLAAYYGKEEMVIYFLKNWPVKPRPGLFNKAVEGATSKGYTRIVGLLNGTIPLPEPEPLDSESPSGWKIDSASLFWALAGQSMAATRRRVLTNTNTSSLPPIQCGICNDLDFRRGAIKDVEIQHIPRTDSLAGRGARGCPGCSMVVECLQKLASVYSDHLPHWKKNNLSSILTSAVDGGPLLVSYGISSSIQAEIFSPPGFLNDWPVVGAARDLPIDSPTDTGKAAILRGFIDDCLTNHPNCPTESNSKLPSRVIDVGIGQNREPRLHIPQEGDIGLYVTLSHCWGGQNTMTTTADTLSTRMEEIPLESLPKTFQDAVIITRNIGVQYLWIDSLCILQDDADDWEREAAQMSTIYTNCHVMIAADASPNCHGGCFPVMTGGPIQASYEVPIKGPGGRRSKVLCRLTNRIDDDKGEVCHRLYDCVHDKRTHALDGRGWTLQERILAPRTLHFGYSEVGWECASRRSCECQTVPTQLDTDSRWKAHLVNIPHSKDEGSESSSGSPDPQRKWIWSNIVQEFTTSRSLTFESDLLPALAGLARTMSPSADKDYMCGLWKYRLSEFLLWEPGSDNMKRHEKYYAPSWSWASMVGPVKFPAFSGRSGFEKNRQPYPISKGELEHTPSKERALIEFIDFQGTQQSANLGVFGPYLSAELYVRGPVVEATYGIRVDAKGTTREVLVGPSGVEATCSWDDPREVDTNKDGLSLLFLSESVSGLEDNEIKFGWNSSPPGGKGLVLRLYNGSIDHGEGAAYSRVGTFRYEGPSTWKNWKEAQTEKILCLV